MKIVIKIVGLLSICLMTTMVLADNLSNSANENTAIINLGTIFNSQAPKTEKIDNNLVTEVPAAKTTTSTKSKSTQRILTNTTYHPLKNKPKRTQIASSVSSNSNNGYSTSVKKGFSAKTARSTAPWYRSIKISEATLKSTYLGHAPDLSDPTSGSSAFTFAPTHQYNPFNFSLYQPTYVLPMYYTFKPDYKIYKGETPNGEDLDKAEFNYQLSFKVPLWQNLFGWNNTIYAAYTQDSFWQFYNDSQFFRETDYEPEVFLDNQLHMHLFGNWELSDLDIGAVHQSNGRGDYLERSWNRAYFNAVFTNNNWMISIKPWCFIFPDESIELHNPNIGHYMGYGQEMIAYNYGNNTFSLSMRNVVESGFSRGAEWATWSFPLIHRDIKGYLFLFSGYGQSLIEYNHYTNAAGIGITLNDWM